MVVHQALVEGYGGTRFDAEEVAVGGGPAGGDRSRDFRGLRLPGAEVVPEGAGIFSELRALDTWTSSPKGASR